MSTADPPSEVELKLALEPEDLDRLQGHPLLGDAGPARTLVSTYFDTPARELQSAGVTLRVRRDGRKRVQTVKLDKGRSAGLFTREEWEKPVGAPRPTAATLAGTPVETLLPREQIRTLEPLFTIEVRRAASLIDIEGAEVEVALDSGTVAIDGRSAPLNELELELKRGDPGRLFAAAERLLDGSPPRLSPLSKFATAFALLHPRDGPVKATAPQLTRGMSSAAAFQAIARACLLHYLGNEALLVRGGSPDDLHQARVALRRMRAAMSLFAGMLSDPRSQALKAAARRLAGLLGEARDLDVLAGGLREGGDRDLLAEVERRGAAAYARVRAALQAPETARLPFDLAAWIEAGDWLTGDDGKARSMRERPIEAFAADVLARRRARVKRDAGRLRELDPERRHRVRIEVKKLRYAAEFFKPLAQGPADQRRAAKFLKALGALQEQLGELNDIAVQKEMAKDFGDDLAARFPKGGGKARLLRKAEKAAARFAETKPFLSA
jgi:inorganic triphosphatase YgiF